MFPNGKLRAAQNKLRRRRRVIPKDEMGRRMWHPSMSDGCTLIADEPRIKPCCIEHDSDYVVQDITRHEADRKFLACLIRHGWPRWKAYLVYKSVRLFGWLLWDDFY